MFQRQCSAAHSSAPSPASSASAIGTRRLTRYRRVSRHPAAARCRRVAAGSAGPRPAGFPAPAGAGPRRSRQVLQREPAGPQRGQMGGEPGVPGRGRQGGEPPGRGVDRPGRRVRPGARGSCRWCPSASAARRTGSRPRAAARPARPAAPGCRGCCPRPRSAWANSSRSWPANWLPWPPARAEAARSRHVEQAERQAEHRRLAAQRQRLGRAAGGPGRHVAGVGRGDLGGPRWRAGQAGHLGEHRRQRAR